MKRLILSAVAGLLLLGGGAVATAQEPDQCATTKVAGAKVSDLPGLLADAACYARRLTSAATSQRLRLDKAAELAKAPPAPTPTPTPPVKPPVGDSEQPELGKDLTKIPDAVPTANRLSFIGGAWPASPPNTGDVVGAFRFLCQAGQVNRDDPLVFPGQPGKSHLHQWFGNTGGDAHSTYASLRASGKSTCMNILNRSAYWMPAMLDGKGNVVRPDYNVIYYKRRPETDPWCKVQGKACVDLPRGMRYIFGYDMQFGTPKTGSGYFNCDGPTAKPGHYATITEAAQNCPAGNRLGAVLTAPDCWDGKRLDSPDHRSHIGFGEIDGNTGRYICPSDKPYIIPQFTLGAWYSVEQDGASGWYLSSDEMEHDGKLMRMPSGSTLHADWLGAWDDETMATWMANCINRKLSCNSGDLGNGTGLNQDWPSTWKAEPRLVPIPAKT